MPACGACLNEGGFYAGIFYWASVPTSPPRIELNRSETSLHAAEYRVNVPTGLSV
jgi:hypothetical protein